MTGVRVLHVEDEDDIREVVEVALAFDAAIETKSCSSGQDALAAALDWRPDIILLDVRMPVMDGPATLARLRTNAQTATIPVVFLTACVQSRELDLLRSLGTAGVISKPFDPMTLAASVRSYIRPYDHRLEKIRAVFLRRLHSDAETLAKLRSELGSSKPPEEALATIKRLAHGLAGAGGIFGYPAIGDAAAALEETIIAAGGEPGAADEIAAALDLLLTQIEANGPSRIAADHSRNGDAAADSRAYASRG